MAKQTLKQKILKSLLNGPKKTGQIAIELGYINKKTGYGKYNSVDNDCKKLVNDKYTHEVKPIIKTRGSPGTTYDIIYEIPRLRDLLIKYDSLISDMQKNTKIIDLLVDNDKFDPYIGNLCDLLTLSESFFRNYLLNDSFVERFKLVWFNINIESVEVDPSLPSYKVMNLACCHYILFEMFKHCVIEDNINGVQVPGAFEYIQNNKNKFSLDHVEGWYEGVEDSNDNAESEIEYRNI